MKKEREEKEKPRILRVKEIALVLNLTPTRVQQLVAEGLPKKLRGKYDRDECGGFYIRYLRAIVERRAVVDK
jgi:hypothetical protein